MSMRDEFVPDEMFEGVGKGIEFALPGDTIWKRHVATRAGNRRRIVVLMVDGSEFEGYSIGLDEKSLQLLEVPSGEVSSLAWQHIAGITDDKVFKDLTPSEKDMVDKRTASFRKLSQAWLVKNWPEVYDRREEDPSADRSSAFRRPPLPTRYAGRPNADS